MKCYKCGKSTKNYDSKKRRAMCSACEIKEQGRECNKCGDCCRGFHLPLKKVSEDLKNYFAYHNCEVVEHEGKKLLYIKNRCRHLTKNNLCDIYSSKPDFCTKAYTETRDNVFFHDKCAFK